MWTSTLTLHGRYACVPICVVTLLTRFHFECESVYELKLFFPNDDKLMSAHIKSAMEQKEENIFIRSCSMAL